MSNWVHYTKILALMLLSLTILIASYHLLADRWDFMPKISQIGTTLPATQADTSAREVSTSSQKATTTTKPGRAGAKMNKEELKQKLAKLKVSTLIDLEIPPKATDLEVEQAFVKTSESAEVTCNASSRMGNVGDGGWNVCEMEPYLPKSPCLVYSFGINNDWSFDDGMVNKYKCLVRSFDPSMAIKDHWRNSNNMFVQDGLSGRDYIRSDNLWRMNTLKTLQGVFGDSQKTIDYLKFDIEFSEWETLNTSIRDGSLDLVKQIGFEIHTGPASPAVTLRSHLGLLGGLRELGFYRWYAHTNPIPARTKSAISGQMIACCHELVYINLNFL